VCVGGGGGWGSTAPATASLCASVCVYTASGDQALLLSRKCQLLQEEKKEKKNVLKTKEKSISLFLQAEFCCYFVQQVLFVR
jgi:hypothetical protein